MSAPGIARRVSRAVRAGVELPKDASNTIGCESVA
jgi:hypothetical protein